MLRPGRPIRIRCEVAAMAKDILGAARMEKFCGLYAADPEGNGKRCAIQAGYSEKTAASQASRLLKRADVRARIQELRADMVNELGLTAEHVTLKLYELYSRCTQAVPVMAWDSEAKAWVESGEWRFDSKGAAKVMEMLMKLGGLLDDRMILVPEFGIRGDYVDAGGEG